MSTALPGHEAAARPLEWIDLPSRSAMPSAIRLRWKPTAAAGAGALLSPIPQSRATSSCQTPMGFRRRRNQDRISRNAIEGCFVCRTRLTRSHLVPGRMQLRRLHRKHSNVAERCILGRPAVQALFRFDSPLFFCADSIPAPIRFRARRGRRPGVAAGTGPKVEPVINGRTEATQKNNNRKIFHSRIICEENL